MARRAWTCRDCGWKNEPSRSRKCGKCGGITRPLRRVPKHEEVLRDMPYAEWEALSQRIHGGELGACGVCGKPKPANGRHQRDHDHRTGSPRGLACYRCNNHVLYRLTQAEARGAADYMERAASWFGAGVG